MTALILIRTHFVDDRIAEMARRLAAGGAYDVLLAIDETAGPVETRGLPKLSMTLDSCVRLGLAVAFDKPLWRCGDYAFYHALALGRAYRRYWLIEYDVAVNFADPLDFFRLFDERASEDYLAACLKVADKGWHWRERAARRFPVVYSALFPVVRLSAGAVERLLERRRFEAKNLRDADAHWPNDESFVASAANDIGLTAADFNAYGEFYSEATFAPHLLRHLSELPEPDNMLYHAVRGGAAYLQARKSYYALDLPLVLACGDPDFPPDEFRAALADLMTERLNKTPDDPAAVFVALADAVDLFADPRVAAALLIALARRRMRVSLEAVQLGRLGLTIARTPAFDNVALGRCAWQSSVSPRAAARDPRRDAEGGNDGDTEAEYGFHTAYEERPWWVVDLAAEYSIRQVRVFNRKLAEQRLRGFVVETSLDFVTWRQLFAHAASDRKMLFAAPIEIVVDPPVLARYVRVLLPRLGVLHLAEVEVCK